MKRLDFLKSKPLDEIVNLIDKYGQFDGSPWMKWFNENYCEKCEPIMVKLSEEAKKEFGCGLRDEVECCYCELENKCKFFPEMDRDINSKDIIKMWLEQEI